MIGMNKVRLKATFHLRKRMAMQHIILDFTDIASKDALHDLLRNALSLPADYGRNPEDLGICLSKVHDYLLIELKGIHKLYDSLGSYSARILNTLDEAAEKNQYIWLKVRDSFLFDDL